jgi:hypothetical protein
VAHIVRDYEVACNSFLSRPAVLHISIENKATKLLPMKEYEIKQRINRKFMSLANRFAENQLSYIEK